MKQPTWLTKHLNEKVVSCTFETLFTMNVPHVLERIFFSLDYGSFKKCKKVCAQWSALLNSESFKTRAKSHFAAEIGSEQRQLRDAAYGGRADEIKKLVSSGMVDLKYGGAQCSNSAYDIKIGKYLEIHACKWYQNDQQDEQNANSWLFWYFIFKFLAGNSKFTNRSNITL